MDDTTNLKLPYILAAQSQKHVTHNEALRSLDTLVQLAVLDRDLGTPPGSPGEGDRYLVAVSPTGGWAGHAGDIAAFQDGAWAFHTPLEGWLAWVADEDELYVFNGTTWIPNPAGGAVGVNPVSLVGVNATADATDRLSVSSPASLFNHEGAGHQLKINKAASGDTASVLFQTGFSGRAEFGLAGDDDFHVKVSADGSTWHEAIAISRSNGAVVAKCAEVDVASAATCDIGAATAQRVRITGTATITSLGTVANALRFVLFAGALTLTHNATSLILPGGTTIATAAGDTAVFVSDGSGNWRCVAYHRAGFLRERLTANCVYYVRTDGSDSNSGLANSSGGAFATLQKAWDTIVTLDLSGYTATVQLVSGTFTSGLNAAVSPVGGNVVIDGSSASTLSTTSANAILLDCVGTVTVQNITLQTATSGNCIRSRGFGATVNVGAGVTFGACAEIHMRGDNGGRVQILSSLTVTGAAACHLFANNLGTISYQNTTTTTISGTPAFSDSFANVNANSIISAFGVTYSGSATGKRYNAINGGGINTFGGGASFFPGNASGTATSPAWYA